MLVCGPSWSTSGFSLEAPDAWAQTVRVRVQLTEEFVDPQLVLGRASMLEQGWRLHGARVQPLLPGLGVLSRRDLDAAGMRALARLAKWFTVELAHEDLAAWWVQVVADPSVLGPVVEPLATVQATLPNDPRVPEQFWYLDLIGAPAAWDVIKGQDGDVVVAVVDTGTDISHPDLVGNLWHNPMEIPGNGVDDDGNGFVDDVVGWNFALGTGDPTGLADQPFNRDHGTHVAGIIAAQADNALGVAGVAFNPRLMAINAADPERDRFLRYGYDGIVYAALMGADIINCSWRTVRSLPGGGLVVSPAFRDFENDVIEAATALGSLVVAAAGNDASQTAAPTPAFYPSVLAVTATRFRSQLLWSVSNTGTWVDLAAPGEFIWSTISTQTSPTNPYGPLSGTSMAAPMVSAAAALLKAQNPHWTPLQLRQRLIGTADSLVDIDVLRGAGAGGGLLRIDRAVGPTSIPGLVIAAPSLIDEDGDGVVEGGEVVTIAFDITSPFDYSGPVDIEFASEDAFVRPLENLFRLPMLTAGTTLEVRRGLNFYVRESVPAAHLARLDMRWSAGAASGRVSHWVELLPMQASVTGGSVQMSAASNGKLGYANPTRSLLPSGVGLRAVGSRASSMALGGLILATGPENVSDAVQAPRPASALEDFRPEQVQSLEVLAASGDPGGRQQVVLRYSDNPGSTRLGVVVEQRLTGWPDGSRGDFVLSHWRVQARISPIEGLHIGVLVDWAASDRVSGERIVLDPARAAQWVEPASGTGAPWAGAVLLEGPGALRGDWLWGLWPDETSERQGRPALYDLADLDRKLSDPELWALLSQPAIALESPVGNVAGVLGSGPVDVPLGSSVDLAMAFAVADDLSGLLSAFDAARSSWQSLREGRDGAPPARLELLTNVPNPFNPSTAIRFAVPERAPVRLLVFDARGRQVRGLLDVELDAGFHRRIWDGRDDEGRDVASGVYFVQLRSGADALSQRLTLLR